MCTMLIFKETAQGMKKQVTKKGALCTNGRREELTGQHEKKGVIEKIDEPSAARW